jgi:serine/threonine protein kinase
MLQTEQIVQNRYQLGQKLGENASRQTWLARDLHTHERVVVKLLTFSDQVQWSNLRLFEREAQVLKQLDHPQIPQYRDYFCLDEGSLWFGLVQQYIPGTSLKELLSLGKTFTEKEVRAIAESVLNILIYLHSLSPPVLHRDIKPSNLIWGTSPDSEAGTVYLVDFGAVQDRAAAEGATFTVVGTFGYAPLEQFGGRATPASDLYALGATLIHLLTGVAPADLPQQDARIQFADRVRLNPGFVRWLERLTEPNLSQRFSTAHQALEALLDNQMASYVIARPQPSGSHIQIKKSPNSLKIKIPVRWFKALVSSNQLAVFGGLALWVWFWGSFVLRAMSWGSGSFVFSLLVWLVGGILIAGWLLLPAFGETTISFNHQQFEIEWRLLGLCWRRRRGETLAIDKVFKSETHSFFNKKNPEVAECYWLVGEMKNWLGLS